MSGGWRDKQDDVAWPLRVDEVFQHASEGSNADTARDKHKLVIGYAPPREFEMAYFQGVQR